MAAYVCVRARAGRPAGGCARVCVRACGRVGTRAGGCSVCCFVLGVHSIGGLAVRVDQLFLPCTRLRVYTHAHTRACTRTDGGHVVPLSRQRLTVSLKPMSDISPPSGIPSAVTWRKPPSSKFRRQPRSIIRQIVTAARLCLQLNIPSLVSTAPATANQPVEVGLSLETMPFETLIRVCECMPPCGSNETMITYYLSASQHIIYYDIITC